MKRMMRIFLVVLFSCGTVNFSAAMDDTNISAAAAEDDSSDPRLVLLEESIGMLERARRFTENRFLHNDALEADEATVISALKVFKEQVRRNAPNLGSIIDETITSIRVKNNEKALAYLEYSFVHAVSCWAKESLKIIKVGTRLQKQLVVEKMVRYLIHCNSIISSLTESGRLKKYLNVDVTKNLIEALELFITIIRSCDDQRIAQVSQCVVEALRANVASRQGEAVAEAAEPFCHLEYADCAACLQGFSRPSESKIVRCAQCGKSGDELGLELKSCGRCQKISYCSVKCQREHWTIHKEMCGKDVDLKLLSQSIAKSLIDVMQFMERKGRRTDSEVSAQIENLEKIDKALAVANECKVLCLSFRKSVTELKNWLKGYPEDVKFWQDWLLEVYSLVGRAKSLELAKTFCSAENAYKQNDLAATHDDVTTCLAIIACIEEIYRNYIALRGHMLASKIKISPFVDENMREYKDKARALGRYVDNLRVSLEHKMGLVCMTEHGAQVQASSKNLEQVEVNLSESEATQKKVHARKGLVVPADEQDPSELPSINEDCVKQSELRDEFRREDLIRILGRKLYGELHPNDTTLIDKTMARMEACEHSAEVAKKERQAKAALLGAPWASDPFLQE